MGQSMATSTAPIDHNTRWSRENLETCRKRRHTDATIARHVSILEQVARAHDGVLPPYKWLNEHGHFASYDVMRQYPQAFAHIKTSFDKKFEVYQSHEKAKADCVAQILPPSKAKSLAEYNVPGAAFHPTRLEIEPGTAEGDWMDIGRALASVCQSAFWWVGDWMLYGFTPMGSLQRMIWPSRPLVTPAPSFTSACAWRDDSHLRAAMVPCRSTTITA